MSAEEDLTFIDVLKVVDSSIKLIAGFKLQNRGLLLSADWIAFEEIEKIEKIEKIEELETYYIKMKKFVMRKLKGKLSELLPAVSMEEDILDNILGHMNPQGEDAKMTLKFVETTEEEKAILTPICLYLEQICRNLDLVSRSLEAINKLKSPTVQDRHLQDTLEILAKSPTVQDRHPQDILDSLAKVILAKSPTVQDRHLQDILDFLAKVTEGEDNIAVEDQGGEEIE